MTWMANPHKKRAYKVLKRIAARDVFVLVSPVGVKLEQSSAALTEAGYHAVRAKPHYAEPGHYTPR